MSVNSVVSNLLKLTILHLQINYAISIMYARHLLAALLADWPSEGHLINTATLGCTEPAQMVSVLDLLQRDEEKEVLKKVSPKNLSCSYRLEPMHRHLSLKGLGTTQNKRPQIYIKLKRFKDNDGRKLPLKHTC